jgi:hypothetical protein
MFDKETLDRMLAELNQDNGWSMTMEEFKCRLTEIDQEWGEKEKIYMAVNTKRGPNFKPCFAIIDDAEGK